MEDGNYFQELARGLRKSNQRGCDHAKQSPTAWGPRGIERSMNSRRAFTFFRRDWDIELHRSVVVNFSNGLVSSTFAEVTLVIIRIGGVSLRCWDKHGGAASLPHKSSQVCTALCITFYIHVRDEFTVKFLHSSFCDTKIELRSSWCDLCSSFFCCVLEKKNSWTPWHFPSSTSPGNFDNNKKDSSSAAAMKWSDVKHFCKPLRKLSSLFAPQITSSFKVLLEVPSTKALHVVIFCNPWSNEEFSCTVCKNQRNRPCWTFFKI